MGRVEEIAKEVDDGRQSGQQQKTAAAAESGRVSRPVRSTDGRVWAKICCSANCGTAGIKGCWVVSRVNDLRKEKAKGSLAFKETKSYCNHLPNRNLSIDYPEDVGIQAEPR